MSRGKIQPKYGKNLISLFSLLSLFFHTNFQSIEAREDEILTVKTFISQDGIHPGKQFQVVFLINIIPGWHIYAPKLSDEFLIPSELIIDENDDVQVLKLYYPEPKSEKFDYSDTELQIYDGEVIFGALFKVSDGISQKGHILKAQLLYQACDDRSCLPPKILDLEIPFKVVPLSQKVNQINLKIFSKIDFKSDFLLENR
jgi:DsbC/DsbD-like thiol-disulfide interchange protein